MVRWIRRWLVRRHLDWDLVDGSMMVRYRGVVWARCYREKGFGDWWIAWTGHQGPTKAITFVNCIDMICDDIIGG